MHVSNLPNSNLTCLQTVRSSFLSRTLFAAELASYATGRSKRIILLFPTMITTPQSYFSYVDGNNLYGGGISEALPIGDFTFLIEDEVASFDLNATTKSDDYGYILEVDLKYPEHLHDSRSDYPLAAEKLRVTKEMLSAYSSSLTSKHVSFEKLSPNLYDKTRYIVHYENLWYYLKHGLQLVKIHRILKFRLPYIDLKTAKRQSAKSQFIQSHFKNLNLEHGKST